MNMKSKSNEGMQQTAASSPALFNRCVIVWMGDWNCGSYLQVSNSQLADIHFENQEQQTEDEIQQQQL